MFFVDASLFELVVVTFGLLVFCVLSGVICDEFPVICDGFLVVC